MGKHPDYWIASTYRVKRGTVIALRRRLGIPGFGMDTSSRWPKKLLALLGHVSDKELAHRFGLRWEAIFNKRVHLGIRMQPRKSIWSKDVIRKFGRVSDAKIAESLGVCVTTVAIKRRTFGIPAASQMKRDAATGSAKRVHGRQRKRS